MIDLSNIDNIYLAPGYTDLRKGVDGISALIKYSMFLDPTSRSIFIFCNRKKTAIKVLEWDGTGFWVHTKKLVGDNRFRWPKNKDEVRSIVIDERQLKWLLDGMDIYPKYVNSPVVPVIYQS